MSKRSTNTTLEKRVRVYPNHQRSISNENFSTSKDNTMFGVESSAPQSQIIKHLWRISVRTGRKGQKVSVCICDNHQTLRKKSAFSLMIVPFGNMFVLIGMLRDPEMSPYRIKNLSGDDSSYPPISHQKCLYPNVDVLYFLKEILGGIIECCS